jgi:S-formylglutathione hydrolase FrmB
MRGPALPLRYVAGLLLLLALAAGSSRAQGRIECGAVPSRILGQPVHYCALLPSSFDAAPPEPGAPKPGARAKDVGRYPVLYLLHGLGDNERSLVNTGAWSLIEDLRAQHRIGEFVIVTPDGGRSFYVNSHDGRVRYSDFFLREFLPAIERKYRVRSGRASRGISGMSMGGYGALRFAFADPQLFGSVSAKSAALMATPPRQLDAAARAGSPQATMLGNIFGQPLDIAYWQRNSPFVLAKKNAAALRRLRIYFDCGTEDEYGFYDGAERLHRQLAAEKIPHEFHLYPGNHSLTYFLQHLGTSLEFHSRAFARAR